MAECRFFIAGGADFAPQGITNSMHGFEKEGIRVSPDGRLSRTGHPEGLGSSLTHSFITTDFAEPQLELVTPPSRDLHHALRMLSQIHSYAAGAIGDELVWPMSMPPLLPARDDQIPLAEYGPSPLGIKKTVYRRGIGLRYGRRRLTLSGVHYNFSIDASPIGHQMAEARGADDSGSLSGTYFHIVRNLFRRRHFFTFLFGASPAFDKSFAPQGPSRFTAHKASTLYAPFATCLRLSDIGYTSKVQDALTMSYNSLDAYVRDLTYAMETRNPDYVAFSAEGSGKCANQLTANYLQIENEFYAPFRLQRHLRPGDRLLDALRQLGPSHIENRMLDIDPGYANGIDPHAMGFIHIAMFDCLMRSSPPIATAEWQELRNAQQEVVWRGREDGLSLHVDGGPLPFHESGKRYCEEMQPLARKMDEDSGSDFYRESLSRQIRKWTSPELTPSGKQLSDLLDGAKEFIELGLDIATKNAEYFRDCERDVDFQKEIETQTQESRDAQRALEAGNDTPPV